LQIVHHQVAVTEVSPSLTVGWLHLDDVAQVFHGILVLLFCAQDGADGIEGLGTVEIVAQSLFVCKESIV
jgi:hypothetical protein